MNYRYTIDHAIGHLIEAWSYGTQYTKPAARADNRLVDRAYIRCQHLFGAFGVDITDEMEFRPSDLVPRMFWSVARAAAAHRDHRGGWLCYTFREGEEAALARHEPEIETLSRQLRMKRIALLRDLLVLARPELADAVVEWDEATMRANRMGYEEDIDDNF